MKSVGFPGLCKILHDRITSGNFPRIWQVKSTDLDAEAQRARRKRREILIETASPLRISAALRLCVKVGDFSNSN
jgi:hypothetical protein